LFRKGAPNSLVGTSARYSLFGTYARNSLVGRGSRYSSFGIGARNSLVGRSTRYRLFAGRGASKRLVGKGAEQFYW